MLKWNNMTREQIGELSERAMVVLPIGATEQHGPHLPVETDNILVNAIAELSVKKAAEDIPVILGPSMPFGFSHHHFLYPGVLSLKIDTLLTVLNELVESVIRSGFKKIFILNGHGGNDEIIRLTAREMALKHPVTVGAASYWTLAEQNLWNYIKDHQLFPAPGHAGQFETSLMLALKPELVQLEQLSMADSGRDPLEMKVDIGAAKIENNDVWRKIDGFSDHPQEARLEFGNDFLEIIRNKTAEQMLEFYKS
ncbi:creatininase family protein [Thalassobacillus devorans]|uniref:creatininase family protein n=1 Tax=Thalassobacillus devorans TaxID=279813 RepID=UPI001592DD49|nr:creatininase family protein [Thalassobacillus devorans]